MQTMEKVFDVGFQSTIDISLDKGKVEVWGWDNPSCKLVVDSPSSFEMEHNLSHDYLQISLAKGEKNIQLYIPKHSKLLLDGSYIDTSIANFQGNIVLDMSKGNLKLSNIDGKAVIDIEKGDIELENVKGKCFIDKGTGDIRAFKVSGSFKIDSGHGDMELISLDGDNEIENGRGDVVLKDSSGNLNLYCGRGNLLMDKCTFKRLAIEGEGKTDLRLSSEQEGVWNISRVGSYDISVPVSAQIDFKIECSSLDNSVPGLSFNVNDGIYKGSMGFNTQSTVYIEDAKNVNMVKGSSQNVINIEVIQEDEKETLRILEMLKQGIITLDQANELIEALEGKEYKEVANDE